MSSPRTATCSRQRGPVAAGEATAGQRRGNIKDMPWQKKCPATSKSQINSLGNQWNPRQHAASVIAPTAGRADVEIKTPAGRHRQLPGHRDVAISETCRAAGLRQQIETCGWGSKATKPEGRDHAQRDQRRRDRSVNPPPMRINCTESGLASAKLLVDTSVLGRIAHGADYKHGKRKAREPNTHINAPAAA